MSVSITVIDYGAGNLRSIQRADGIVFPGVGAAGAAMDRLHELGLVEVIGEVVAAGRPFLGICLGMQLLFEHQEEGNTRGLGLLQGRVQSLGPGVKVPQIGWNRVQWVQDAGGYPPGQEDDFYFVHSYVVEPKNSEDIVAVTRYGDVFPSVVRHEHVWGTQFHPEKSGPAGLRWVAGWVDGVRELAGAAMVSVRA